MKYLSLPGIDTPVSPICLGGMTFGEAGHGWHQWTLDADDTRDIIGYAFERGITFIDTANSYAHGTSEDYIGRALRDLGIPREKVVLASKVFYNDGGTSARAIRREIEGSLRRLRTDYLDLYILHRFDYSTPIEETLSTLDDLVRSGKIRAIGASEMYAYQFHNMIHAAEINGWVGFSTMQCHHNLLYRENERELLRVCRQYGVVPTPYSPLASGHLTRPTWDTESTRSQTDETMRSKYDAERDNALPIIARVKEVADKHGVEMAQVALAWQWSHGPAVPVVGCSRRQRVDQAIAATTLQLSSDDIAYLEEPYIPRALVGPLAHPGEAALAGEYRA
ncbi:aldo/keto reductase [Nanchangia anserum]|uniref:Aldo/keto reductase n=1 Tax=Nanchangia anserum TaxID=2692125 RepID=A0A8I0KR74_9ACTO|nr:aldo/keto reductase [Nanchangia anserum]MBD3689152.1 aldo/keto reductase [Nanchangia anserum]QOX81384.1 aldo/keto reductase [Nanchangia anserum]